MLIIKDKDYRARRLEKAKQLIVATIKSAALLAVKTIWIVAVIKVIL